MPGTGTLEDAFVEHDTAAEGYATAYALRNYRKYYRYENNVAV